MLPKADTGDGADHRTWVEDTIRLAESGTRSGDLGLLRKAALRFEYLTKSANPVIRAEALVNLASVLVTRYEISGDIGELDRALSLLRNAAFDSPANRSFSYLATLSWALLRGVERSGDIEALNEAIKVQRLAVRLLDIKDPRRPDQLAQLGGILNHRFALTGQIADVNEAIKIVEAATRKPSQNLPGHARRLSNLGCALARRAAITGNAEEQSRAVSVLRSAVEGIGPGDPFEAMVLSNFGVELMHLYERSNSRDALDESVALQRMAIANTPPDHVERQARVANLAVALLCLYERTGSPVVLEDVVQQCRDALTATPTGHANRAGNLSSLAGALVRRYEHTGDTASLHEAINLSRQAIDETRDDHPAKPLRLSAHATALRSLSPSQLPRAADLLRQALGLIAPTDIHWPTLQTNLGGVLGEQYDATGDESLLEESCACHRAALEVTSSDHYEHCKYLANLMVATTNQAGHIGLTPQFDEVIGRCRQARDGLSPDDPGRAVVLGALGAALEHLAEQTHDAGALAESIDAYRAGAASDVAPLTWRLNVAFRGAYLAMENNLIDDAVRDFTSAIDLMVQLLWCGVSRTDQMQVLSQLGSLPTDAAAAAILAGRLELAVELLERGRGILLSQALDDRSQLDIVRHHAPDLAEQLTAVYVALEDVSPLDEAFRVEDLVADWPATKTTPADRRTQLARQRDELVAQIRSVPGCEDFLRSPSFRDLASAADDGPAVIVNVSKYRCDALTVQPGGVSLTPLTGLDPDALVDQVAKLSRAVRHPDQQTAVTDVLAWAWDYIALPVLSDLGPPATVGSSGPPPHIWWCPTGQASHLPLHAAGCYKTTDGTTPLTTLDLAVSSYTPTLRALVRARAAATDYVLQASPLIVAMPTTPGLTSLSSPLAERDYLLSRVPGAVVLLGDSATLDAVTSALPDHLWVHFSCHGSVDRNTPSQSALVLHDGRLTVERLMGLDLPDAAFAYLSACDTVNPGPATPDEAFTLGSALQLAGYQHVVAALWPIPDNLSADFAERFHGHLIQDDDDGVTLRLSEAAWALREALRAVRDEYRSDWHRLASLIHMGP